MLLAVVEAELLLDEDRADEAKELLVATRAGDAPRVVDLALSRAENRIGIALASSGRSDEAAFAFKRACDLDDGWAPPRANLGARCSGSAARARPSKQYRRALTPSIRRHTLAQLQPVNGTRSLRERGDLDGAVRAFTTALDAEPPHRDARVELALALAERGDDERAIELFEEELRLGRPTPSTLRNLAKLYARGGRLVEAAAALFHRAQGNSGALRRRPTR